MLRRAEMHGFRGLDLTLEELGRVNVIVGRSGVGKTCLLEGLLLSTARANAQLAYTLATLRGVPTPLTGKDFGEFIDEFATRGAEPKAVFTSDYQGFVLRNSLERVPGALVPALPGGALVSAAASYVMRTTVEKSADVNPLVLEHFAHILADGGLWSQPPNHEWDPASYFRGTRRMSGPLDLPQGWSALDAKQRRRIVDFMRKLQPGVQDISVVVKQGPLAQLRVDHATLGSCSPSMFGDGFGEMLTYLLTVARARGGVLLFDEFCAPLDATTLEDTLPAFLELLREENVQLVASTHSLDVLDCLLECASADDGMRVLQMSRDEAGAAAIKNLSREDALTLRQRYGFDLRRAA